LVLVFALAFALERAIAILEYLRRE
jgi:hypothetical protein